MSAIFFVRKINKYNMIRGPDISVLAKPLSKAEIINLLSFILPG